MSETEILNTNQEHLISSDYSAWKDTIISQIHTRQLETVLNVNAETLQNYWEIGRQILQAQNEKGWGSHVIDQLSHDLEDEFGKGTGYSVRNLKYMRMFAEEYPDFPIWQVSLAESSENMAFVQVPLAQITWYHHISNLRAGWEMNKAKNIKKIAT